MEAEENMGQRYKNSLLLQPKKLDFIQRKENARIPMRLYPILIHLLLEKSGNNVKKGT